MAFPHAQSEAEWQLGLQLLIKKLADVFDRRVGEKIVPVPMVILGPDFAGGLLEIGEIENHSVAGFAFDDDLHFVGVTVQISAFGMSGKEMRAINVVDQAE